MEEWKDIKNYEGKYQVSNYGRVRSLNYNHTGKCKNMKLQNRGNGYLCVCLVGFDNTRRTYSIHNLVAKHFLENPDNLPVVLHKNGIKTDNRVYNLKYGTYLENNLMAIPNKPKKRRQIRCIDTNMYFRSSFYAAEWLQQTKFLYSRKTSYLAKKIRFCCNGLQSIAFGYRWEYVD